MSENPFIKFINIIYVLSFAIFILFLYFKGVQGVQGIQGIQGLQGLQGDQGLPGSTGLQGQRGERGSAGQSFSIVKSYANLTEFNAANKLQYQTVGNAILLISDGSLMIWTTANEWIDAGDIKGNDGEVGPQGPQGLQGLVGNTGPQGVQGQQGQQGNKGDTGLQGQKGDKGDKGDTGLQGQNGLKGDKGDKGDPGDTGLQGQNGLKGDKGDKGDPGDTVIALQYGSFYDLSSQFSGVANTIQAIKCNFTLFNKGVQIINSTGGQLNASRLKILIAGRYNIQFSVQLHQGNSSAIVNIWLRKNGTDVEYSNTKLSIASNNPYLVAAWNFFVDASINDYYELIWSSNHGATKIEYLPESNGHPAVPSVILTIHQIGL